jgi:hypothetical protein
MACKIDINNRYIEEEEVRKDYIPYMRYAECIINTFNMKEIESFCDIGCATGHLLYYLKTFNNNLRIKGYEYFEYHKNSKYCKDLIRDKIEINDIRNELSEDIEKYDIVNCSEVGEHIDKNYADILINNAKNLSNKYIIFTWSSHGGENERHCDPNHQHLNPLSRAQYIQLMTKHNLKPNIELTKIFLNTSNNFNTREFYSWWRESFIIWEKY